MIRERLEHGCRAHSASFGNIAWETTGSSALWRMNGLWCLCFASVIAEKFTGANHGHNPCGASLRGRGRPSPRGLQLIRLRMIRVGIVVKAFAGFTAVPAGHHQTL